MDPGFEPLVDLVLDIDPEDPVRDEPGAVGRAVLDDETISLLRRENRVGIARGAPIPVDSPQLEPGRSAVDVPLLFALQAHPECVFQWARIVVDLSPTESAVVADMSPRDVQDVAVEIETAARADLSFSLAEKAVDIGLVPEISRKRTVFFPTVTATGTGFHKAYWDFHAKAGDYLHADKELHLLIDAPDGVPVNAALTIRAKVTLKGIARLIPLLGRTGSLGLPETVRLA